ncbi:hypothetical protein, partial [Escherichia coli]|uniref:hypothetical protein n=1 Tax=Escherichia coli TaxID=562 RepID=UPI001BAEBF07
MKRTRNDVNLFPGAVASGIVVLFSLEASSSFPPLSLPSFPLLSPFGFSFLSPFFFLILFYFFFSFFF